MPEIKVSMYQFKGYYEVGVEKSFEIDREAVVRYYARVLESELPQGTGDVREKVVKVYKGKPKEEVHHVPLRGLVNKLTLTLKQ